MTRTIPYAFDTIMEADERLQDASFFFYLSQEVERLGDVGLEQHNTLDAPPDAWGRDWHGVLQARHEMAAQTYADPRLDRMMPGKIVLTDPGIIARLVDSLNRTASMGAILRNMRNPVILKRHCAPDSDLEAHLRAIQHRPGDEILVQPDHDLRHMRRFLVVKGKITGESPMAFDPGQLHRDADLETLQARDITGDALIRCPEEWRHMQATAALMLLSDYPLESGAIDVGLVMLRDTPVFAKVENVTAAPPGGVFPYMADIQGHALAVADRLAQPAPTIEGEPTP